MRCLDGQHTYRPFPRSRDLYCSSCGDEPSRVPVRVPLGRVDVEVPADLNQPPLPFGDADPYAAQAREIIEQQRGKTAEARAREVLEAELRRIIGEAELPGDQAEELLRDAMEFGPELDLDHFAGLVEAHRRAPPADDISDVI